MTMAHATWDALKAFAIQTGRCECVGDGDPEMWKTVEAFAKAPGGNPYDSRTHSIEEIDPWYLLNKVRLLGVSP
jgi:hypothetical protein